MIKKKYYLFGKDTIEDQIRKVGRKKNGTLSTALLKMVCS
jgi:hypothetical protein